MKTEQINLRLGAELIGAIERLAREESLDRATAIRRLLEQSIRRWEIDRALDAYRRGELSIGRTAEEVGLTQWEVLEAIRAAAVAYPLDPEDVEERLGELANGSGEVGPGFRTRLDWLGEEIETLADIAPRPGGVLLVGINPAPVSVAAGHYYQGPIGRRLWARLERIGLLQDAIAGAEDEGFARAGNGLTDVVKRPSASSAEVDAAELREGAELLAEKIGAWRPSLVLFAFKGAAEAALDADVTAGSGLPLAGAPTFLLSGPYASREETARIDGELRDLMGEPSAGNGLDTETTQRVTEADLAAGRIRLPGAAKRFFPAERGDVELILRGERVTADYDPRLGPDRPRSAVLSIGKAALAPLVAESEVLSVSRGLGGVIRID